MKISKVVWVECSNYGFPGLKVDKRLYNPERLTLARTYSCHALDSVIKTYEKDGWEVRTIIDSPRLCHYILHLVKTNHDESFSDEEEK